MVRPACKDLENKGIAHYILYVADKIVYRRTKRRFAMDLYRKNKVIAKYWKEGRKYGGKIFLDI